MVTFKLYLFPHPHHHISKCINVSENSSTDDKFNFLLEASRRSNMICLQLYAKETEGSPGESAASSISSRHLNSQGVSTIISCKTQVRCFLDYFDVMSFEAVPQFKFMIFYHQILNFQFQDLVRRLCAWRDLMVSS